ncbi:hypothetical protein LCGC14_2864760 [marine sediment metagenome]|uniref:NTP pyrophosphohydrolase MazG putative catalytic core domain-containing protein n=1 Tax=marine sediment metagenome TaxID=412755 RepID=A0A0F8Y4I5_9ZZZZ
MTQGRSDKDHRPQIETTTINEAEREITEKLFERLKEKGYGTWLSRHEIFGIFKEEEYELVKAIHGESIERVKQELIDVAVACIFGVACINSDKLDW